MVIIYIFFGWVSDINEDLTTRVNTCAADGSRIQTFGRTCMVILIGGREYIISPTVANIEDNGIIGMDFASLYGAKLNPVTKYTFSEGEGFRMCRYVSRECRLGGSPYNQSEFGDNLSEKGH